MNFLIDFDHTLYKTELLIKDILSALAKFIEKSSSQNYDEVLQKLKDKFSRGEDKIYDTYELIEYFGAPNRYNYDKKEAINIVNEVIFNGSKYLFEDTIPFLRYLKENKHKVYILTYSESGLGYQAIKLAGSEILGYVDGIFIVSTMKGEIPFDFSNCVFVDDKPKDLKSIYSKHPLRVFRVRRPNEKYSNEELDLPIEEVTKLTEINKKIENI